MTYRPPDPGQTRRPMRKASPNSNQRRIRRKQTAETNQKTQRKFLMHSVSNSGPAGTPGPPTGPLGTPGPGTGEKSVKSCLLRPKIGLGQSRVALGDLFNAKQSFICTISPNTVVKCYCQVFRKAAVNSILVRLAQMWPCKTQFWPLKQQVPPGNY